MYDMGEIIRKLRSEKGYSQTKLAAKLNKSKSTISKYESNQKTPPLDILIELSVLFNVSLDYLSGIEKRESIFVNDLTPDQRHLIQSLLIEFHNKQQYTKKMTERQTRILSELVNEFFKQ